MTLQLLTPPEVDYYEAQIQEIFKELEFQPDTLDIIVEARIKEKVREKFELQLELPPEPEAEPEEGVTPLPPIVFQAHCYDDPRRTGPVRQVPLSEGFKGAFGVQEQVNHQGFRLQGGKAIVPKTTGLLDYDIDGDPLNIDPYYPG